MQRSRLTWIKLGDTNTGLFHSRANAWRRKNFIASLTKHEHTDTSHEDKAKQLYEHYKSLFGTIQHAGRHSTGINYKYITMICAC
jgi:hypothetical protein